MGQGERGGHSNVIWPPERPKKKSSDHVVYTQIHRNTLDKWKDEKVRNDNQVLLCKRWIPWKKKKKTTTLTINWIMKQMVCSAWTQTGFQKLPLSCWFIVYCLWPVKSAECSDCKSKYDRTNGWDTKNTQKQRRRRPLGRTGRRSKREDGLRDHKGIREDRSQTRWRQIDESH